MEKELNWLDYFYYAAPLWLALEVFLWPGFRAGIITGGSLWGNLAFYSVEGGLGAALYFRLPYARPAVLAENALYLLLFFRYILFSPLDIASRLELDPDGAQLAAKAYTAALPGAIYSCFHIILRVESGIRRLRS